MSTACRYLAFIFIMLLLNPGPVPVARATMVIPSSLEYMTGRAETIVLGRVTGQSAYWEDKVIYTAVAFEVSEYIKGGEPDRPATLEIKVTGGQVGDIRLEMDQAPVFNAGEEALLFLVGDGYKHQVYGIYYGAYRVSPGTRAGSKWVSGPLFDNREVHDLATRQSRSNTLPVGGEDLARFIDRIRSLLESR
ncbi:MAG: hypothetical protein KKB20_19870 [Proteobacteria bacterium]|nr:hypothetical protein [Pseudomonadota bacterium]